MSAAADESAWTLGRGYNEAKVLNLRDVPQRGVAFLCIQADEGVEACRVGNERDRVETDRAHRCAHCFGGEGQRAPGEASVCACKREYLLQSFEW